MNKEWWQESPQEFADGFTESAGTHHNDSPKPRFYAEQRGSWCVRDREILIPLGVMRGQPHIVQSCGSQVQAEELASKLNATRGHASDEPRCVNCGSQPAGPVGSDHPMCVACHSRLADLHR